MAINHESMLGLDGGSRRYCTVPDAPSVPPMPELKQARCDKNSEIEKIKRTLAQLIDRVEALKKA